MRDAIVDALPEGERYPVDLGEVHAALRDLKTPPRVLFGRHVDGPTLKEVLVAELTWARAAEVEAAEATITVFSVAAPDATEVGTYLRGHGLPGTYRWLSHMEVEPVHHEHQSLTIGHLTRIPTVQARGPAGWSRPKR